MLMHYRIAIETNGGHSFRNFGSPNAIERMAQLIGALYRQPLPQYEGSHPYNVGTITGGTSTIGNTIAQNAEMLYEFRSDRAEALEDMERQMHALAECERDDVRLSCEEIGRRPAGSVDTAAPTAAAGRALARGRGGELPGTEVHGSAGSTDCRTPFHGYPGDLRGRLPRRQRPHPRGMDRL